MAQYTFNPPSESVGTPDGLTLRSGTDPTLEIVDDGGNVLRFGSAEDEPTSFSIDAVDSDPDRADFEIYAVYRRDVSFNNDLLVVGRLRSDGADYYRGSGGQNGAGIWWSGIQKRFNDTPSNVVGGSTAHLSPQPDPTRVHQVFRAQGNNLYGKIWFDDDEEPASWMRQATDTDVTAAGHVGLMNFNAGTFDIEFMGVGTGGDDAPRAASGGGGASISTTVYDASGNPVSSADVYAVPVSDVAGTTGAGGEVTIAVDAGEYVLVARKGSDTSQAKIETAS